MILHLANYHSMQPFRGWRRFAIDFKPPMRTGEAPGTASDVPPIHVTYARRAGKDCHLIDVFADLAPGRAMSYDLARMKPKEPPSTQTDDDEPQLHEFRCRVVTAHHGILETYPFYVIAARKSGAGIDMHLRAAVSVGQSLFLDLWTTVYPGQPFCSAVAQIFNAGESAQLPKSLRIEGAHDVRRLDGEMFLQEDLLPETFRSEWIVNGQALPPIRLVAAWGAAWGGDQSASSLLAIPYVCGHGVGKVWPNGNPVPPTADPVKFVNDALPETLHAIESWQASQYGIASDAYRTGREGDQVFVGGEVVNLAGGERLSWAVAAGYARRPIHLMESDGSHLDIDGHPDLCLWDGRPFPPGGSTDTLGLEKQPTKADAHDWWSWAEHDFFNRLAIGYRLTGCPALQWQLEARARQFLFSQTLDPKFSTSRLGTAREWGWKCLAVYHLWHNLDDRELARQVIHRWKMAYILFGEPFKERFWDVRTNDPRLSPKVGRAKVWMVYQQAAAAYFMWITARAVGEQSMVQIAKDAAAAVPRFAFSGADRAKGWGYVGMDGPETPSQLVEGDGAHYGRGIENWILGPVAAVLKDLDLSRQVIREHNENGLWIPPECVELVRERG